jgi:hypothetical protein
LGDMNLDPVELGVAFIDHFPILVLEYPFHETSHNMQKLRQQ